MAALLLVRPGFIDAGSFEPRTLSHLCSQQNVHSVSWFAETDSRYIELCWTAPIFDDENRRSLAAEYRLLDRSAIPIFECKSGLCTSIEEKTLGGEVTGTQLSLDLDDYSDKRQRVDVERLQLDLEELEVETVKLRVGARKYLFDRPLTIRRDIEITGQGVDDSRLVFTDSEELGLRFHGEDCDERLLGESTGEVITLTQPDCSMRIIFDRDKIWPLDWREYVHYGGIESVGGRTLSDFRVLEASDEWTLGLYKPVRAVLRNLTLEGDYSKTGRDGDRIEEKGFLQLDLCHASVIEGVKIKSNGNSALWISRCQDVVVIDSVIESEYMNGCRTCYGIQTYGAQDILIEGNTVTGARRGIDLSGNFPSRRVIVRKNAVTSSQVKKRNSNGMGTHGPADGVAFIENSVDGGLVGIMLRGGRTAVLNNNINNFEYSGIYVSDSSRLLIEGNKFGGRRKNGSKGNFAIEFVGTDNQTWARFKGNVFDVKKAYEIRGLYNYLEVVN